MKCTILLIFMLGFLVLDSSAQTVNEVIAGLNGEINEIKSFNSEDTTEFKSLEHSIQGFKIIGLGEATHGTREFYEYKAKVIKYLILKHHLKIVIFESDMAGMEAYNRYVMGEGSRSLHQLMNSYGMLGIYRTQEVATLIEWIKTYNSQQKVGDKVMIAGMDAQHPYGVATKLLQSTALLPYLDDVLKKDLTGIRAMPEARNLGSARKKYLFGVVDKLDEIARGKIVKDSVEIYRQYIRLLAQSFNLLNLGDIPMNAMRDVQMAENVAWLAERTNPNETIAVWAHNGHITADKYRNYKSTGKHLREKFKDRYYALGLVVGEGYARLWNSRVNQPFHSSPLPAIQRTDQAEFLFQQLKFPNFYLNMRRPDLEKSVVRYFSKPVFTRALGAQTVQTEQDILLPIRFDKSYDGIAFFKNTSAATDY